MKAIKKISFWSVAVLVVMGFSLPSMATVIWSDNFEDGNDTGWREHWHNVPDVAAYDAVAGAGVGGSFGYVRTDAEVKLAEGIFTPTSIPDAAAYQMSADIKLSAGGASRIGLRWGYNGTGGPGLVAYSVVIQDRNHLELMKGSIEIEPTIANGTPLAAAGLFDGVFGNLSATFEKEGADLRIKGFVNGVEQLNFLDTAPLISDPSYAGVMTTFGSQGTVFDNIVVQTLPIPEPASLGLMVLGAGLMLVRRKH